MSIYFSRLIYVLRFIWLLSLIVWIAETAPGAKYTKADLAKAVDDVANKKLRKCDASCHYGTLESTIRSRLHRRHNPIETHHLPSN